MIPDKIALVTFTAMSVVNVVFASLSQGLMPFGVSAVTFALLAIAWRPLP